jgi:hypothetical protein
VVRDTASGRDSSVLDAAEFLKRAEAIEAAARELPEGGQRDDLLRNAAALRTTADLLREQEERRRTRG